MTEVQEMVEETTAQVSTEVERTAEVSTTAEEVQVDKVEEQAAEVTKTEQEVEETEEVQWSQAPKAKAPIVDDETDPKNAPEAALEKVNAETQALQARVQELESQLNSILSDPLVKTYSEYLQSTDAPNPSEFLSRVGAAVNDPYANVHGEELVKTYYSAKAKSLGLEGEDLEEAVEEELINYSSSGRLRRKEMEAEAKKFLSGDKKSNSLEELEKEFEQSRIKQTEDQVRYTKENRELMIDYLNTVVDRGRFNDRPVDAKWKSRMIKAMDASFDIFNSMYFQYAEPNEKGVSYLYAPDVVDTFDYIIHKNELKKTSSKKVASAKAESLEEKAKAAHELEIKTEKIAGKAAEGDLAWFDTYKNHISVDGSMHPNDPRRKENQS